MDSLLQRGEKLDDLVTKSDMLSAQSKMFYKTSKKTNSCCYLMVNNNNNSKNCNNCISIITFISINFYNSNCGSYTSLVYSYIYNKMKMIYLYKPFFFFIIKNTYIK